MIMTMPTALRVYLAAMSLSAKFSLLVGLTLTTIFCVTGLLLHARQNAAHDIVALAAASVKVAERSGGILNRVLPAIRNTAELVQEVATASREQAVVVTQVYKAITEMDRVTEHNAAAEELSSAATEKTSQAKTLQQLTAFFRVNETVTPPNLVLQSKNPELRSSRLVVNDSAIRYRDAPPFSDQSFISFEWTEEPKGNGADWR